jgi:hypothetical protein
MAAQIAATVAGAPYSFHRPHAGCRIPVMNKRGIRQPPDNKINKKIDLLRWVSELGKERYFFSLEGFLREHSPAI